MEIDKKIIIRIIQDLEDLKKSLKGIDIDSKDEPIEEFQDAELVDREYEDQIIFFEVKDGKTKILYSSFNGVGKFL